MTGVACDDAAVFFPDGEQERVDAPDFEVSTPTPTVGPVYTGTRRVVGSTPGHRVGGGALLLTGGAPGTPATLLIGAPGDETGGRSAGSLSLRTGLDSDESYDQGRAVLLDGAPGDSFGCSAMRVPGGDLLAVSACSRSSELGEDVGAVYLFDSTARSDDGVSWQAATGRFEGALDEGHVGTAMAAGDFDGDGTVDLAVGAPDAEGGRGRAYVLEDIHGIPWQSADDLMPLTRGTAGDDAFGSSLAAAGDLTGDGRDDLVACAPGWDVAGEPGAGACVVVPGGLAMAAGLELEDAATTVVYATRSGQGLGAGPGSVAIADFLGTGELSVAIGVPGDDEDGGGVVVLGRDELHPWVSTRSVAARIDGTGRLGWSVAAVGSGGLLVGAPDFGDGGAVFGLRAADARAIRPDPAAAPDVTELARAVWVGLEPGAELGTRVGGGLDVDGDLWPDVVLGAPGARDGAGEVLVEGVPAEWLLSL